MVSGLMTDGTANLTGAEADLMKAVLRNRTLTARSI
jgi:hypothetical protein